MIEIILTWKFVAWVVLPVLFHLGTNLLERNKPEIFKKHQKRLLIGATIYFFLAMVVPGLYFITTPKQEVEPAVVAPIMLQEQQASQEFFKEPPEPKKGQGPGFPAFK